MEDRNVFSSLSILSMAQRVYGPVSIDQLTGNHLPYKDNLVNLIIAGDLGTIPWDEAMRVLTPIHNNKQLLT